MDENGQQIEPTPPVRKRAGRPKGSRDKKPRVYKDPERISAIRRAAWLTNPMRTMPRNGGRDRGGHHPDTVCPGERRIQFLVPLSVHGTIKRCAKHDGVNMVTFLSRIATYLRASPRYAALFAQDGAPQGE